MVSPFAVYLFPPKHSQKVKLIFSWDSPFAVVFVSHRNIALKVSSYLMGLTFHCKICFMPKHQLISYLNVSSDSPFAIYLFHPETYSHKSKPKFSSDSNLYFKFSGDLSKDNLSEFQIILYLDFRHEAVSDIQQYVSLVIESITSCNFNHRNKLEAYIPTLFNSITQQARRLHAAD